MKPVDVIQADITTLDVDAIVNAANERLLGGGGVDGAIHRAAGPELLEACRAIPEVRPGVRCPTGEARITPGFRLPAEYVIHTVGPVWQGGDQEEPERLASCYRESMQLAEHHGIRSIAFPAISCGVYGYPVESAAEIAVREVSGAIEMHGVVERVLLVGFDDRVIEALERALRQHES
jgi:O-acetyl-ADP-ribose deacetylase (regulator of RNase III)